MQYIAYTQRGELDKAASESFDCVMCGLCASRCPAHIVHYNVGILARRIYGKLIAPPSEHLRQRAEEIEAGKFDAELDQLMQMDVESLKDKYNNRDIEK